MSAEKHRPGADLLGPGTACEAQSPSNASPVMRPRLFACALMVCLPPALPASADAGLAGHWEGDGSDEDGQSYEIELAIGRDGRASFEYGPRDGAYTCTGTLTLLGRENDTFIYRDSVTRGPADCRSYGRVALKPTADGTSLAYDRTGGGMALHALLHGFRLTVQPETCAECDEAESQDAIGCRYLARQEGRTSEKACLDSAAASAKACRAALHCPATAR